MCKLHDRFYNENSDTESRNISDLALSHRENEIANDSRFDGSQRRDAKFVSGIMKNKARFGLGIKSKNLKEGSNEERSIEKVVGPFEKLSEELHNPIRRKFDRCHVNLFGIDDTWGADLVEMQELSKENKGYRYMLNVIDIFSKYAWSIPLKDKKGTTVLEAFKQIVKISDRIPKHIWVDEEKEFYNKEMTGWLKENNIIRYSTHGEHKSAVIERFNRTLKEIMWKRFTAENTRNWIDMIDKLISNYNNRVHYTIGMTPVKARLKKNEEIAIQNTLSKTRNIPKRKPKYKVADKVRISRIKGTFEKGYLPNWSEQVYIVDDVLRTTPVTYRIKDSLNEIITGSFYEQELQKTNQEVYRVEKVLGKKKIDGIEHALVKWSGYGDKFNEWIPITDTKKL